MNAPVELLLGLERIDFELDGAKVAAYAGETILQAADRLGAGADSKIRQVATELRVKQVVRQLQPERLEDERSL